MTLGGGFAVGVEVELVDTLGLSDSTGAAGGHGRCSLSLAASNECK